MKSLKEEFESEPKSFALIYLDITKSRNVWRLIASIAILANLILVIVNVYTLTSVKYIPYIVSVNDTGELKGIGVLNKIDYEPKEGEIKYFIKEYIKDYASVPIDKVIASQNLEELQYFSTDNAISKLTTEKYADKLKNKIGKVSTAVEIISINKQAGADNVFIARWREKTFDNQTKKETVKVYSGTFSVIVDSKGQTTEEEVLHNPLGIFINDFSISEEQ